MNPLIRLGLLAPVLVHCLAGTAPALTPVKDGFGTTSLNTSKWKIATEARGRLIQKNGSLSFVNGSKAAPGDSANLELKNNQPGYNENWEIVADVSNHAGKVSDAACGLWVFNATDPSDAVFLEFYGAGRNGGFNLVGVLNGVDDPMNDIRKDPDIDQGSIRIRFDKSTKHLSLWFDRTGSADGFQWVKLATYSTTGKGGDRRGNWNMNPAGGRFGIRLFGSGDHQTLDHGQVTLDNFALKPAASGASVVSIMKQSIRNRQIREFSYSQVLVWKKGAREMLDGELLETGLVTYRAETIFGNKDVEAKAYIKDGRVLKWVWPRSGMEIN